MKNQLGSENMTPYAAMSSSAHNEETENSEPIEQHKHQLGVIREYYSCNKNCETKN